MQLKYMNIVLTINAVLLLGLLWSGWSGEPVFSNEAAAQSRSRPQGWRPVPTVPNAGKQRDRQIQATEEVQRSVDAMVRLLESGDIKVQVTNQDEIQP
jgi:hypothetical protein